MGPAVFAAGIRQSGFFTKSSRREEEPVIIAGKLIPVLEEPSEAAAAHALSLISDDDRMRIQREMKTSLRKEAQETEGSLTKRPINKG